MWSGNINRDAGYDGMFSILKAKSVKELEDNLYKVATPPQALVWATVDGHIGNLFI